MPEKNLTTYMRWGIAALTALFSIFLFYLNSTYPYFPGDDLVFQLIIPEDGIIGSERITSLGELFESQYNFYFNYHYRVLNHFILQALLALPPIVFDVLNVLVFLALPIFLLKFSQREKDPQYWLKYFFLLMFIWVFHINLGWAYFPATGALNYTWYLIPQLWYLALLLDYLDGHNVGPTKLILLAGVNALGNENACIMLCLLTAIVLWKTRKRNHNPLYPAFVLFMIGGVFMLASPSIGKRLDSQGHLSAGLIAHMLEYTKRLSYYLVRYLPVLLIAIVSINRKSLIDHRSKLLIVALVAASLSMVLAPLFEARSAVLGFFIVMVLMIHYADAEWKQWPVFLIIIVAIILAMTRLPEFRKLQQRHAINEQILEANRGSKTRVYLERYCDYSTRDYLLCHENSEDPTTFDNRSVAAFYNIKEVALSERYVQRQRRQKLFAQLRVDDSLLKGYKQVPEEGGTSIYYKQTEEGIDLLIASTAVQQPYYIVRGAPRGINKYRLFDLLPPSIRIYFLDYIEGNTMKEQESIVLDTKTYNYIFVADKDRYSYLLLSRYSFDRHAPEGEVFRLNLD